METRDSYQFLGKNKLSHLQRPQFVLVTFLCSCCRSECLEVRASYHKTKAEMT
jgi:hypothetical protein